MRIDHCPKCGKAGLRWQEKEKNWDYDPHSEKYTKKYCPRCKEWIVPVDKPYKGGSSKW